MSSLILIHVVLLLWCTVYSFFLNWKPIHTWYNPDHTWLTVVFGCGWIGLAQMAIIASGTPLDWRLILSTNVAAGIPVIIWQLLQAYWRFKERQEGRA